jgi:hypothetical protein
MKNRALCSQATFSIFSISEKVKSILDFEKWTKINVQKRDFQKSLENR